MGRNQYELDMANPEVMDYLIQVLDELLSENAIDYIKWDHEPLSLRGRVLPPGSRVSGKNFISAH